MIGEVLDELAALVLEERDSLLARWREQVRELPSARKLDVPSLNDHIPGLLDELAAALQNKCTQTIPEAVCDNSPTAHGLQRLSDAFDIEEVVAEYNILRGCIHDLADNNRISLQGKPFHIINLVFDHAIGLALKTYATQRAYEVQKRREDYLAFVAHDLRTPLNAIALAGRVLEATLKDQSAETSQMLNSLHRNVKHLESLVAKVLEENSNLDMEGGVKLEPREIDLWPLVESVVQDLHPEASVQSIRLINKVPDNLEIYADASLMKRVFQNLLANAIRYTPGGNIVVGASKLDADGGAECWVTDNGAGIPESLIEKIFEKGETDPNSIGGAGLGLAIVKTFAEAHGGSVTVESKEGVGSTFRITLPAKGVTTSQP